MVIKELALKATFLATMWEEMLEASPEDPSAWAVTRKQAREPGLKKGEAKKEEQAEQKGGQKEEGEVGCRRRENGRSARDKTENKPGQLVVSISRGVIHWYIEGYLQDPAFEGTGEPVCRHQRR